MAPIPECFPHKGREAVVNFPLISDAVLQCPPIFKGGEPLKKMQSSRFMRCSSLSSEEESFQLFGHDRKEYFRSLAVSVKMKTSVSSFTVKFATMQILLTQRFLGPVLAVAWMKTKTERKRKAKSPWNWN